MARPYRWVRWQARTSYWPAMTVLAGLVALMLGVLISIGVGHR